MRTRYQMIGFWVIALTFSTFGWTQSNSPANMDTQSDPISIQLNENNRSLGQDIQLLINLAEAYKGGYIQEVLSPSVKIDAANSADNVREDPLPSKRLETIHIEDYNEWTGEVESFTMIEIVYGENLLPTTILSSSRMLPEDPWEPSVRIEFLYDGHKRKISEEVSIWDVYTNSWGGIYKVNYDYPVPGQLIITEFDAEASYWAPSWKEEIEIDVQGRILNSQLYHWNRAMAHWHIAIRCEMDYDVSGKIQKEDKFLWDAERMKWKLMSMIEYRYGENDELLEQRYVEIDEDNGIYFTQWKYVFNYSKDGKRYSQTYLYWDDNYLRWNYGSREIYTYDPAGALTTTEYLFWDIERTGWVKQERDHYQVQHSYAFEDAIVTDFIEGLFFERAEDFPYLVERIFVDMYNEMLEEWMVESSITFQYADLATNNISYKSIEANVFPNPNNGILFIETNRESQVSIFDANGRHVLNKEMLPELNTLYLDNLENGLYYILIQDDISRTTKKVILQR